MKKLQFEIEVDDNGTAKIKKFGRSVDKTDGSGKKFGHTVGGLSKKLSRFTLNAGKAALKVGAIGAAMGAMAGMYALARGLAAATSAAMEQRDAEAKLGAVLKATGNAAGFTLGQLKGMASGFQEVTTFGDETILSGMALLATFKNIRGEAFERTTKAAMDMATVMGTDLQSSLLMLGKAVNDPLLGLTALGRAGVQFNDAQKEQIELMVESGDLMGAQTLILEELESQFGGAAEAAGGPFNKALGQLKNTWGDLLEEVGFAIIENEAFVAILVEVKKIIEDMIPKVKGIVARFSAWIGPAEQLRGKLEVFIKTVKAMIWPLQQVWKLMQLVGKGIGTGAAMAVGAVESAGKSTAAWADSVSAPSYQSGTGPAGLPHTGMFHGHKGEIVKNPAESNAERAGHAGGGGVTVNLSPRYMTGDANAARNVARDIKRELDMLGVRWGEA